VAPSPPGKERDVRTAVRRVTDVSLGRAYNTRREDQTGTMRILWPGFACSIRSALPREIATDMFP
jgi:hypothetical protein